MNQFLRFDEMITPKIIQVIFIIGAAIAALAGLGTVLMGLAAIGQNALTGIGIVFLGLVEIVVGPLAVRVYCELAIVLFKIHESLVEIRRSGGFRQ